MELHVVVSHSSVLECFVADGSGNKSYFRSSGGGAKSSLRLGAFFLRWILLILARYPSAVYIPQHFVPIGYRQNTIAGYYRKALICKLLLGYHCNTMLVP